MASTRKHTALLVIDMQKDFVEEDGLMRVDGGKAIVPSVIKAVEVARELGILVVWVVREHDPLGRDVELFRRHLYGPGKVGPISEGSVGAELVDGLVIKEGDYKLVKTRFSAFFATHLHSFLQSNGINSVVIVGVQTPNCVRQTVFDAVALDYQSVAVIVDATAAATPDIHFGYVSSSVSILDRIRKVIRHNLFFNQPMCLNYSDPFIKVSRRIRKPSVFCINSAVMQTGPLKILRMEAQQCQRDGSQLSHISLKCGICRTCSKPLTPNAKACVSSCTSSIFYPHCL